MTKVIFDPGHGGRDPGAIGDNLREKDVVLPPCLVDYGRSLGFI